MSVSASTTTTITEQQLSQLDYLFKKASSKKVKTDGLQGQPLISADNETINVVDVFRSDRFWADSAKLTSGPSVAISSNVAAAQTLAQFSDIHAGVSNLAGRAWTSTYSNWISTDFHPYYALTVYYGAPSTTPTYTVDPTAYPYIFDYGSGTLTFIGNVPSYLATAVNPSQTNVLYVTGWTYTGIIGTAAVSTAFAAPSVTTPNSFIANLASSNSSTFINVTGTSFSNVSNIDIQSVTASVSSGIINFNGTTVSNINVSYTGTAYIGTLTNTGSNPINVSQTDLTNIHKIDTVSIGNTTTGINRGIIDCTNTIMSNVNDLYVNRDLYTNSIKPISGTNVSFNGANVNSISNLSVVSSLNVAGEFIVTNLSTSNAEQMNITNSGLGTALIVNQTGIMSSTNVTQFMVASNTVMYTNFSGQTAFGSFGPSPNGSLTHNALLYVENPSASNQPGVYIKQNATANVLTLEGSNGPLVNFTSNGLIGLGTTSPGARIECSSDSTTPFLRLTTSGTSNGFVVNPDGRIGVLEAPDSVYAINVNGTVNTTSTITTNLSSQSSNINISYNTLSNIKAVFVDTTRSTRLGTSNAPAFTFDVNDSTGVFSPATNMLAVTTNSNERLRIDNTGKIGIGSTSPQVIFDIKGTDAIRVPVGTTSGTTDGRPNGVTGYIRYNTDIASFEGFGPGQWGTLGGVRDATTETKITAQYDPSTHDCNIRFYIASNEQMRIASNNNVGIHTTVTPYDLTVNGTISATSNYTNMLSTLSATSNIDVNTKSFSNVTTLDVAKLTSTLGNNVINASLVSISNISSLRTSNVQTTIITPSPGLTYIDVTNTTLSNINTTKTSTLEVSTVKSLGSQVDMSYLDMSNIRSTLTSNLQVTVITTSNPSSKIDISNLTLSNINTLKTSNLEVSNITSTLSTINASSKNMSNLNILQAQSNVTGSASTPAYTFNADSTTGMFQPAVSNLSFSTAGNECMSIIANGNIGINSTSPQVVLDINGTDAIRVPVGASNQRPAVGVSGYIRYNTTIQSFEGFGAGNQWGTLGGVNDPITLTSITAQSNATSHDCNIRFYIAGSEVMRIASNNNVGIATTVTPYALTVAGTASSIMVYTNTLSTLNSNSNIDVDAKSLVNLTVVDTAQLKATRGNSVMNANGITITNLLKVDTYNLAVEVIRSSNAYIDTSGASFCNLVDTMSSNITVNAITSSNTYINVSGKSLSNITDLWSSNIKVNAINSDGAYINVSGKSFSNITNSQFITVQTSNLTTTAANSNINVTWSSLSNVNTLSVANIRTDNDTKYINMSGTSLDNLVDTKSSNITINAISSSNTYINVSGTSLSNITDLWSSNIKVNAINSDGAYINVSGKSFSNITTGQFITVQTSNLTTTAANSNINVTGSSLSNVNFLSVASIRTDNSTNNIDMTGTSFSNLARVDLKKITALGTLGQIDGSLTTLCNMANVRTSNLEVSLISTAAPSSVITYASGITLSNLNTMITSNLQVTNLSGIANNTINASGATLCNLATLYNTGTTYTNSINTFSSNIIDFNAKDVKNIDNLFVNNSINVAGEFFVTNVLTCNAERMTIDNQGIGPAFVVNQSSTAGTNAVATFSSSSNLAFFVNGNRQSAFGGSFGSNLPQSLPFNAQVYVESVSADAQDAVYIKQDNFAYNALNIQYATNATCGVVIDGYGRLGMGTSPAARFHVYHTDTTSTNFIQLSTVDNDNAFVVNADGTVGIGTTGTTSSTVSISESLEVPTITPPASQGYISFSGTTMSNVNTIQAASNSAGTPTYSFVTDPASGMYQSAMSQVSIATASTQRVVVDSAGRVGVGVSSPLVTFHINGSDALRIPVGGTLDRPPNSNLLEGYIRYNTDISSFEGYGPGNVWGSLGGVSDPVTGTAITAQSNASSHDCNMRFFIAGVEKMRLAASNGNLGIKTTTPAYDLTVNGTTSTTTLYTNTLSTLNSCNAINADNMSLCNIRNVQANVSLTTPIVDTTVLRATASNNVILASNISLSRMYSVDTANLNATTSGGLINVNSNTLSNATLMNTSNLQVVNIQPFTANGTINVSNASLSNLASVETDQLYNVEGVIDVNQTSLNNVNQIYSNKITTPSIDSLTGQISFNGRRVLDVDSLVVRSNITISIPGAATITNLPTSVVQLNSNTGMIPDGYISSNFVRLMTNSNTINPSLIPALYTSDRASFIKTTDRVGIGIRTPAQKLHVYGNQVITGGNLGIGTTNPMAMFHMVNDNGLSPGVRLDNPGSVDLLAVYGGSNNYPALYINASCNVGVGTSAAMYPLDVCGTGNFSNVRTNILSSTGTINCTFSTLSNVFIMSAKDAFFEQLTVTSNLYVPQNVASTNALFLSAEVDTISTSTITSSNAHINMNVGLNITGYDQSLVSGSVPNGTRVGLNVANYIVAQATLTVSDERAKKAIVDSIPGDDLQNVLDIPVKRFKYITEDSDGTAVEVPGFIAQEVESVAPFAVRTLTSAIPNIVSTGIRVSSTTLGGFSARTVSTITPCSAVKILVDGIDKILTVDSTTISAGEITFNETIPEGKSIFVYGTMVNDFKVLDSERLLPLVFNAVKDLNGKLASQQTTIASILQRLEALEAAQDATAVPVKTVQRLSSS